MDQVDRSDCRTDSDRIAPVDSGTLEAEMVEQRSTVAVAQVNVAEAAAAAVQTVVAVEPGKIAAAVVRAVAEELGAAAAAAVAAELE